MILKKIILSLVFVAFSAHQFIYKPFSYFSYYIGVIFLVASIGSLMTDSKKKKKK